MLGIPSVALSQFLRWTLTHFNSPPFLGKGINWLHPQSFGIGMGSFYGMPWETFRTDNILPDSKRPVTFYTKGGGLPCYVSIEAAVPEYNLGFTILVAGNGALLNELREVVTVDTIGAAERLAAVQMNREYAATYVFDNSRTQQGEEKGAKLNSSVTLSYTPQDGLVMNTLISNGTDVFKALPELKGV